MRDAGADLHSQPVSSTPLDLCNAAIAAARRLQGLQSGRIHVILLVKLDDQWMMGIEPGVKVERVP